MSDAALLESASALAPHIQPHTHAIEVARRLPPEIVHSLADAGLFRMLVPRALGGLEVAPLTMVRAIETIARADSAAGWCVMVASTTSLLSAYLDEATAREVYGDPRSVTSGVFAPLGKATDEGEHYVVSGRWPFASGLEHCTYRMGGAFVIEGGQPRVNAAGEPIILHALMPAHDTTVLDTWNTSGLRGTGSHDMLAEAVSVPRRFTASLTSDKPRHDGSLYRFPIFGLLAAGVSAVALAIARESVSTLTALATEKRPMWSKRSLAHREVVQTHVAEAEGKVRAARAFLFEAIESVTESARNHPKVSEHDRAMLRLAATHATRASAEVVNAMYTAGGGTAIYATNMLQRHLRDVHVATQHVMVGEATLTSVGKVLLGVPGELGML